MNRLSSIFKANEQWANKTKAEDQNKFDLLSAEQNPKYLWIGCSDSRVLPNELCQLGPGDLFVHRNIANQVVQNDTNCLSVLQYAVDVLKVTDIIICGHYGCGGVQASLTQETTGPIDNWLDHIRKIYADHSNEFAAIKNQDEEIKLLTELNIKQQVLNLSKTETVKDAWKKDQEVYIHGLVYSLKSGLLQDLNVSLGPNN